MITDISPIHTFKLPLPLDVSSVNVYFTSDPVPTLIDVPPDDDLAKQHLESELAAVSCPIENIARILITHPHFDHFGSAGWIVSRSKAEVWIVKDAAKHLEQSQEEFEKDLRYYCRFLEWAGTPKSGEEYLRDFYDVARKLGPAVKVTKRLKDGDRIEFGPSELTVVRVPGHTPWCTLFYDAKNGEGFAGDFLINGKSSNAVVHRPLGPRKRYKSLVAYILSLQKTKELKLRRVFSGHGRKIEDAQKTIDDVLNSIYNRQREILNILKEGSSNPYELMKRVSPNVTDFQVMLGVSEIVGHLELLEERGMVERAGGGSEYRLIYH